MPVDNNDRSYLVLVERITRMERDIVSLDAQLERANDNLSEARSDVRAARQETSNMKSELSRVVQLLYESNKKLDLAREEITKQKTEMRIMGGLILLIVTGVIGLIIENIVIH